MPRPFRLAAVLFLAAAAIVSGACNRRRAVAVPVPAPAVANRDSIDAAARARTDSLARVDQARRDSLARVQAAADSVSRMASMRTEAMRSAVMSPIYFDYDSDALSEDARSKLDAKLPFLSADQAMRLRIAGHADERGSDEYNLALGQRRAAAAKRYLAQRGIADARIEIISYGEERPAEQGADESVWRQNRRAEFEITAGGGQPGTSGS
ncbi:MAG: peptidoglycan-associated lipoprotein Pal [Gemmatimonadaceae bacterium]